MLAITASNSATPSSLTALAQGQVGQAHREADQGDAVAQNLRAQVSAAEQHAKDSHAKPRTLQCASGQRSQAIRRRARQGLNYHKEPRIFS